MERRGDSTEAVYTTPPRVATESRSKCKCDDGYQEQQQQCSIAYELTGGHSLHWSRSRRGAGRHTKLTVKRPTATTCTTTQTARERAGALTFASSCLDGGVTHSTPVDFGPVAVGSSVHKHYTSPNVKPYGSVKSRKKSKSTKMKNKK